MPEPLGPASSTFANPAPFDGVEHDVKVTVRALSVEPVVSVFRVALRHRLAGDITVAVAAATFAVGRDYWGDESRHSGLAIVFDVLLTAPLAWRRRTPATVFAVIALVAFTSWLADVPTSGAIAVLISLYTVGAHEQRRLVVVLCVALGQLGVILAALRWAPDGHRLTAFVLMTGTITAAWVMGVYARTRHAYITSALDRAVTAERERDQRGLLAAAAERARISREMHDIVAHTLSVMVALSDGAAIAADRDVLVAQDAMRNSATLGRQALSDLRRLLEGIRADDEIALTPTPGVADLEDLVSSLRTAGLPVELVMTGQVPLTSPGLQLAVYRIVQESLTNVLKHARGATHAVVTLSFGAKQVLVEIVDDGQAPAMTREHGGSPGRGLKGMQERAGVLGAVVKAGPRPDRGWRVSCVLDVEDDNGSR